MIERTPITSSLMRSHGHDGQTLHVEFNNGSVYAYPVSTEQYHAMLAAESVGAHFSKHIRPLGGSLVEDQPAEKEA